MSPVKKEQGRLLFQGRKVTKAYNSMNTKENRQRKTLSLIIIDKNTINYRDNSVGYELERRGNYLGVKRIRNAHAINNRARTRKERAHTR